MAEKKLHLIMPMGGRGSRFFDNGFILPKPLIEIKGKPFFYWAVRSITKFVETADVTFVVLRRHRDEFSIDKKITAYFPEARIETIPDVLNGAVLTCLEGLRHIPDGEPILFNDCDHLFCSGRFNDFCRGGHFDQPDGALLTFSSHDPKFSFVELDDRGRLIRTVEKAAVSGEAICGAYYFKNKAIFSSAVSEYLDKCQYKEYFVSGVYNVMADRQETIQTFPVDFHLPFGTPEEYAQAENSDRFEVLLS